MSDKNIIEKIDKIMEMYKRGELGGEIMPEDSNPHLNKDSLENYLYYTLPMALNYQRNSYTLWESALNTYIDKETNFVFNPEQCLKHSFEDVQKALTKYKLALQKQKQTEIWIKLCKTFMKLFNGDIRKLFDDLDNDIYLELRYVIIGCMLFINILVESIKIFIKLLLHQTHMYVKQH